MSSTKLKRGEVDRWTGNAIGHVSIPEANKKYIAELNAEWARKEAEKKKGSGQQKAQTKKK